MFLFPFYKEEADINTFWGNRKYLSKSREYGKSGQIYDERAKKEYQNHPGLLLQEIKTASY